MLTKRRKIARVLRKGGYRLTPQRRVVLDVITDSQGHLTPARIYDKVRERYPAIGLVTVYRTLEILMGLGLICEVHAGGNCRSYLLTRPREHHHHLICSECGRVVDFIGCDLNGLERKLSRETGFEIENHLLEFLGCCQSCRKAG